jgi:hypothetical protein
LDLEQIGPKGSQGSLQVEVLVGKHAHLPARLILVRVPEEVIEHRRERIREDAGRRGTQASQEALSRAQWTILITNVPAEQLSLAEVIVLQRARGPIERLFRLWKDGGKIDAWPTTCAMSLQKSYCLSSRSPVSPTGRRSRSKRREMEG